MKPLLKLENVSYNISHVVLSVVIHYLNSGRNKDQKLVGRFLENQTFCRLLIAVPLKMYSKFGRGFWSAKW